MLAAMENAAPEHPPKRPRVETSAFTNSKGLEQFCTANSMTMFRLLLLQTSFMSKDPSEWDEDETYQCALRTVKGLAGVNDRAERGVALIQDYNKKPRMRNSFNSYCMSLANIAGCFQTAANPVS
ncbi:hypothetical protein Bpfe_001681 [Biomphalaria pfeifferi]|uniref:Uncharacterized protein n=1 Tax=Biomphalaria pfeifferi TaxID=112525 RepID=A0AAD8FLV2_BIOPF|nr:hypothetical protein Bpfe_001681 [Biomphalaria pfeifferi]